MGGVAVTAGEFGLKGPRGWVFRGIEVAAEPGSLIAVEGPSGSGRTCLLMTLTGRMKATEGTATVGSARLPKRAAAVRRVSALANVSGVTDLEPALTVAEHLRERALLERRFTGSLRGLLRPREERGARTRERVEAALAAAGLDPAALPKGARTAVRDLERLEALRLSVALALVGRPGLLGVDDVDLKLSDGERAEAWRLLRSLAEAGTTVLAVCAQAPEDVVKVSTGPTPAAADDTDADETDADKTTEDGETDGGETHGGDSGHNGSRADAGPGTRSDSCPDANTSAGDSSGNNDKPARKDPADEKETADALAETGRA